MVAFPNRATPQFKSGSSEITIPAQAQCNSISLRPEITPSRYLMHLIGVKPPRIKIPGPEFLMPTLPPSGPEPLDLQTRTSCNERSPADQRGFGLDKLVGGSLFGWGPKCWKCWGGGGWGGGPGAGPSTHTSNQPPNKTINQPEATNLKPCCKMLRSMLCSIFCSTNYLKTFKVIKGCNVTYKLDICKSNAKTAH